MSNLGQIRTVARGKISQTDETNTDFTNQELNSSINEGARFLGVLVKKPTDHVEVQAQVGYPAYNLPGDALLLATAYFGDLSIPGDVWPISIITEENLKEIRPSWMDESAQARGRPQYIILADRKTVLVNPTPDDASSASGKKIHINYVYQPALMVNDSDEPDLPLEYHDLLADYTQHLCYLGKLKQPDLGVALLQQIVEKAKKLEPMIIKEAVSFGFAWGRSIDPNDDFVSTIRP